MHFLRSRVHRYGRRFSTKCTGVLPKVRDGNQVWFIYIDLEAAGYFFPEKVTVLEPDFCHKASETPLQNSRVFVFSKKYHTFEEHI